MGSFSPWIMRVGQLISGSSSIQILPDQSRFNVLITLNQFKGKNLSYWSTQWFPLMKNNAVKHHLKKRFPSGPPPESTPPPIPSLGKYG